MNLIREHALADAEAGNWSAVASTLNALTRQVNDATHWSFGLMMSQGGLPEQLVTGISDAVDAASQVNSLMKSAFIAFSTTGLQLHTDERQAMIEAIGAGLPSEAVAAVKALGRRTVPVITTDAAACESAWVQSTWTTLQNEIINPAVTTKAGLIVALRTAAATLENG